MAIIQQIIGVQDSYTAAISSESISMGIETSVNSTATKSDSLTIANPVVPTATMDSPSMSGEVEESSVPTEVASSEAATMPFGIAPDSTVASSSSPTAAINAQFGSNQTSSPPATSNGVGATQTAPNWLPLSIGLEEAPEGSSHSGGTTFITEVSIQHADEEGNLSPMLKLTEELFGSQRAVMGRYDIASNSSSLVRFSKVYNLIAIHNDDFSTTEGREWSVIDDGPEPVLYNWVFISNGSASADPLPTIHHIPELKQIITERLQAGAISAGEGKVPLPSEGEN
ncbi:hypothetical protein GQ53DRAFT_890224 [Thozetella sp. PMI_491]|nr:hypothetical protein GQ53DRAFT_890224 [Thozetella sp. PMI_491]